jgi:hypothetical protein
MVKRILQNYLEEDPCRLCRSLQQRHSSGDPFACNCNEGGIREGRGIIGHCPRGDRKKCKSSKMHFVVTTAYTRFVMPAARGARSLGAYSISLQTDSRFPSFMLSYQQHKVSEENPVINILQHRDLLRLLIYWFITSPLSSLLQTRVLKRV